MKKIVILGGGYAGVTTAIGLRGIHAEVTLINKHSYHHLTTLLHQPAVGRRSYGDISVDLKHILLPQTQFVRATVQEIQPDEKSVIVKARGQTLSVSYDFLVVALGWEPQFFDIPGLREGSLTLQDLNTSRLAKDRIEESLIAFDENPDESWRTTFVIGGGGLTGVELAGELVESLPFFARSYDLATADLRLIIIEGHATLLPGLDPWIIQSTTDYLKTCGVEILAGVRIASVQN
jgi:NADH:ubiquinone reductase (H+-translocating)